MKKPTDFFSLSQSITSRQLWSFLQYTTHPNLTEPPKTSQTDFLQQNPSKTAKKRKTTYTYPIEKPTNKTNKSPGSLCLADPAPQEPLRLSRRPKGPLSPAQASRRMASSNGQTLLAGPSPKQRVGSLEIFLFENHYVLCSICFTGLFIYTCEFAWCKAPVIPPACWELLRMSLATRNQTSCGFSRRLRYSKAADCFRFHSKSLLTFQGSDTAHLEDC